MINPDNDSASIDVHQGNITNHYFPYSIASKVPATLRWLALIYFIAGFIGLVLMGNVNKQRSEASTTTVSVLPALKSKPFWVLFSCAFCSSLGALYIPFAYKNYGESVITDDAFLSIVGSVASVFNGSFRYIWAHIVDQYSFRFSYILLLVIQITMQATLFFVGSSKAAYLIWISLLFCCEGGHFSIFPALLGYIYGADLGGKLYGIFAFVFLFSVLIAYAIQLYLVSLVGYLAMFLTVAGFTSISLIVMIRFKPQKKIRNSLITTELIH